MKLKLFVLAAIAAVILLGGFQHSADAKGGGTKTIIALSPSVDFPNAKGKAVYKVNGAEREFEAEADNVKKLAGKSVQVYVNGVKVGSALVDALGTGRLELSTQLGQSVPAIKAGDKVEIKTGAGKLILSGKF